MYTYCKMNFCFKLIINLFIVSIFQQQSRGNTVNKFEHAREIIYNTAEIDLTNLPKAHERWYEPYLDHFNISSNKRIFIRYFEYPTLFKSGGPLVIEIGGQTSIKERSVVFSPSYYISINMKARLIYLEHRFYGRSKPGNYSGYIRGEDLKYVSIEQTLEDIAYFIEWYKGNNPDMVNSKVGLFGCSYAGVLAFYMRYKFPHLVQAAWVSSVPIYQEGGIKFPTYSLARRLYNNAECIRALESGYKNISAALSEEDGMKKYAGEFRDWHCGDVTAMDKDTILYYVRFVLSNPYNRPDLFKQICNYYKELYYQRKHIKTFESMVDLIVLHSGEACSNQHFARLQEDRNDIVQNYQTCLDLDNNVTVSKLRLEPLFFSRVPDSRGNKSDRIINNCAAMFFYRKTEDFLKFLSKQRKNQLYGAIELKYFWNIKRVFIIQGTLDPWYNLGEYLQKANNGTDRIVRIVNGTSHCADYENITTHEQLSLFINEGLLNMKKWLKTSFEMRRKKKTRIRT